MISLVNAANHLRKKWCIKKQKAERGEHLNLFNDTNIILILQSEMDIRKK